MLATLAGCGGVPSEPPPPPPPPPTGLRIVSAPPATDTIEAIPLQALVVEYLDDHGNPLPGVVIRFAAGVVVRFGLAGGPARISISAPEFGKEIFFDTTVRPGAPARLTTRPADTTLYPAGQLQLSSTVVDRWLNPRTDPVSYALDGPSLAAVTPAGAVTVGAAFGSTRVRATAQGLTDTAAVRVVPHGTMLAASAGSPSEWVIMGLDGSGTVRYPATGGFNLGLADPAWLPDGSAFLCVAAEHLVRQPLNGPPALLITTPVPTLAGQIHFATAAGGVPAGPVIPGLYPAYGLGDQIALVRGESVGVVNVDGSGFRLVGDASRRYAQLRPSWSPDNRWLLLRGAQLLELVEVATGLTIPLPWSGLLTHPAWKPGT